VNEATKKENENGEVDEGTSGYTSTAVKVLTNTTGGKIKCNKPYM
jgi:hypothetical protein